MVKSILAWVLCTTPIALMSQAQQLEFAPISELPSTVNSTADELMPLLSPDGNKLFFVRAAHPDNVGGRLGAQDIWQAKRKEGRDWKKATPVKDFNNHGNNAIAGIRRDGERVYLLNSYENSLGTKSGLSYSDKRNNQWGFPVTTKIEGLYNLRSNNDIYGLSVNSLSDVLLISMKGPQSLGQEDLYVSFKFTGWNRFYQSDSSETRQENYWWSPPIHLGNIVNSTGYEISPFLSDDGKTMFFSSNRKGGYGSADIYFSTRLDDTWTNWTEPTNLGRRINSRRFDGYFFLTTDSSVFFSSARSGRLAQIYSSKLLKSTTNIVKTRSEIFEPIPKAQTEINIAEPVMMASNQLELNLMNSIERNILFDLNSSNLLLKDLDILTKTINILIMNQNLEVHMIGHTDEVGSAQKNEILARERAAAVKAYLIQNGISGNRIIAAGAGENNPIADNNDKKGRELNRRVELRFEIID